MDTLKIFTDGAVSGNGNVNSKVGYGVYISNTEKRISHRMSDGGTNQTAELRAIQRAIKHANKVGKNYSIVEIYSDSQYSISCITIWYKKWVENEWKNSKGDNVVNKEIIMKIIKLISECPCSVFFYHVRSHTEEPKNKSSNEWFIWNGNRIADELAFEGKMKIDL